MATITCRSQTVWQGPTGQELSIPIYRVAGSDAKAPSVYIQASLHGAEVQGNGVIYHLLQYLTKHPPLGTVVCVPAANPYATHNRSGEFTQGRCDPISGFNWNRGYLKLTCETRAKQQFSEQLCLDDFVNKHQNLTWPVIKKSFKEKLRETLTAYHARKIQEGMPSHEHILLPLQKMALEADIVLDLHTAPNGTRYLYSPHYAVESSKTFNIQNILSIPNHFAGAMDEACFCPWWELSNCLDVPIEYEAYTLEFGGQESLDLEEAKKDCSNILSYLYHKGVTHENAAKQISPELYHIGFLKNYQTVYAPYGGLYHYIQEPGSKVTKGQNIAHVINTHDLSHMQSIQAPCGGLITMRASSSIIHQGDELFKILSVN